MAPRLVRSPMAMAVCALAICILLFTATRFEATRMAIPAAIRPNPPSPSPPPPPIPQPPEGEAGKRPKLKPEPSYLPPPVPDPFEPVAAALRSSGKGAVNVPAWNVAPPDLHKTKYGLPMAPMLFIGFGRTWPVLIQCVVSYITAGWPAAQIIVVENTGVQLANKRGNLTLQNPFFLNYTVLEDMLGVKVMRTPAILNFAQMQNFFLHMALERGWDYYLFSHSDQLVFGLEEGADGITPPARTEGYKSLYELVLGTIARARAEDPKHWGKILYAYNDYLTTFRTLAMDSLGGWDSMIPFYMTDCDMYSRMRMGRWNDRVERVGHFNDVSCVLPDLRSLYRDRGAARPDIIELNPLPPAARQREQDDLAQLARERGEQPIRWTAPEGVNWTDDAAYFAALKDVGDMMSRIKLAPTSRGRNTWQMAQHGGQGEPYYYDPEGVNIAINTLTDAGRKSYKDKWGTERCDADATGVGLAQAWRVAQGWW